MKNSSWFQNEIIYHILIDRFSGYHSIENAKKPLFVGGTIKGIRDKVPYLKDLGVTTLWISPFYRTSAYHGYHITDFYTVDPHYGSEEDLIDLIDVIHKNKMHIIADFVPNHCSHLHPIFLDAKNNPDSSYKKWFYFMKWPDEYLCFLSITDLPKINLDYPPARNHIINAALKWLELGLDGYRLDHVIGPSNSFWKIFVKEIRRKYPHLVLIGEAWMQGIRFSELSTIKLPGKHMKWLFGQSSDWLLRSYDSILDGVLDFKAQHIMCHLVNNDQHEKDIIRALNRHYRKYSTSYILPFFLDNHDMDRILFQNHNNKKKLMKAASIQFSIDQPVIIYYGTERGMTQNKSIFSLPSHGDILARQPIQWDLIDTNLFAFYKKLIKLKKN